MSCILPLRAGLVYRKAQMDDTQPHGYPDAQFLSYFFVPLAWVTSVRRKQTSPLARIRKKNSDQVYSVSSDKNSLTCTVPSSSPEKMYLFLSTTLKITVHEMVPLIAEGKSQLDGINSPIFRIVQTSRRPEYRNCSSIIGVTNKSPLFSLLGFMHLMNNVVRHSMGE